MTTTFEKVKIGDRVWCYYAGWGVITSISHNKSYPIVVKFDIELMGMDISLYFFTLSGCTWKGGPQCLFWDEVKIVPPEQPIVAPPKDTKVLVWEGYLGTNIIKYNRYSAGYLDHNGGLVCYAGGKDSWTNNGGRSGPIGWSCWEVVDD